MLRVGIVGAVAGSLAGAIRQNLSTSCEILVADEAEPFHSSPRSTCW
jgi:hypothetical protein